MKKLLALCFFAAMSLTSLAQANDISYPWYGSLFQQADAIPPGMSLRKLMSITSDRDNNVANLSLMLDRDNQIMGMFNQTSTSNILTQQEVSPLAENIFWLQDIESAEGAVVSVVQGRKALILQGKLDRATQEGTFRINYLANGFSMRYESCDFHLRKSNGTWVVQNAYTGVKVNQAKVITWSLGITTIQGLCPVK